MAEEPYTPTTDDGLARYVEDCPENGKSHDCSHRYIMWMPVELFAAEIAKAQAEGFALGWFAVSVGHDDEGDINPVDGSIMQNPYRAAAIREGEKPE
jgi:hypothetical protein